MLMRLSHLHCTVCSNWYPKIDHLVCPRCCWSVFKLGGTGSGNLRMVLAAVIQHPCSSVFLFALLLCKQHRPRERHVLCFLISCDCCWSTINICCTCSGILLKYDGDFDPIWDVAWAHVLCRRICTLEYMAVSWHPCQHREHCSLDCGGWSLVEVAGHLNLKISLAEPSFEKSSDIMTSLDDSFGDLLECEEENELHTTEFLVVSLARDKSESQLELELLHF